jgi:signal transduction histidine kinase
MGKSGCGKKMVAAALRDFPAMVRRTAHDLTQPVQALRMMLDLPGVLVADGRGLPDKTDRALAEAERRLSRLQQLARRLDGAAAAEPRHRVRFSRVAACARTERPDLWDGRVRCGNLGQTLSLPPGEAAEVLNVLIENAHAARARRIVVGARGDGRRIVVADDGEGMAATVRDALLAALAGGDGSVLGGGLSLARLVVAGWGGSWRLVSRPAHGTCVEVSIRG